LERKTPSMLSRQTKKEGSWKRSLFIALELKRGGLRRGMEQLTVEPRLDGLSGGTGKNKPTKFRIKTRVEERFEDWRGGNSQYEGGADPK